MQYWRIWTQREENLIRKGIQSETRDQVINEKRHYNKGRFSEMKTEAQVLSLQGVYGGNSYGQGTWPL